MSLHDGSWSTAPLDYRNLFTAWFSGAHTGKHREGRGGRGRGRENLIEDIYSDSKREGEC